MLVLKWDSFELHGYSCINSKCNSINISARPVENGEKVIIKCNDCGKEYIVSI